MTTSTFFDLLKHMSVTSIIAIFLWYKYRNLKLIIIAYLAGVLVDVDHLFDYFVWAGWRFDFSEFFDPSIYVRATNKAFVLLHGWEYLMILWLIAQRLKRKVAGIHLALILPYLCHLLIDQSPFTRAPLAYFFVYRLINNFSLTAFNGH